MKSRSQGYASMEYSVSGYRENDLCRLDILIAGEPALPLAAIVHREEAHGAGTLFTPNLHPNPNPNPNPNPKPRQAAHA